ncbi:unnamed protein product [Chrysodeixis includens]|uniref:Uncharacterized protein n=1 Tax=Chrysodeixis includens TaxID=689277 RepID=A0A9N8KZ24_CHRIL|nr:unnamed protein product [Chrysodeixis includens]
MGPTNTTETVKLGVSQVVQNYGPIYAHTATGQLPPKNPLTADDKQASRKAKTFVNFIKIVPQLNPLLAPKLGPYYVELPDVNFSGEVYLENLSVVGLNSLTLPFLEVRMAPTRVDFNATVPKLSCEVLYDLQGTLGNQPINVQGRSAITLNGLGLSVAVGVIVEPAKLGPVYQVNSADVDIDIGGVTVDITLSQYEEDFRVILTNFLTYPAEYAGVIQGLLNTILGGINKELENITANEIITYLLGPGKTPLRG